MKLCDFGSAFKADESQESGEYLVSRFYRAPETILGFAPTSKIDVWSLGVTLAELFSNKIVFDGKNNSEIL